MSMSPLGAAIVLWDLRDALLAGLSLADAIEFTRDGRDLIAEAWQVCENDQPMRLLLISAPWRILRSKTICSLACTDGRCVDCFARLRAVMPQMTFAGVLDAVERTR